MKKRDKKQLLPGIVLSVAVGFLVFLYAPIDLYCSNADEFWFDFGILFTAALGLFAVCVAVMSLAYIVLWLIPGPFPAGDCASCEASRNLL